MRFEVINSLNELKEVVNRESSNKVIILFMASLDPQTGKSWCPDCREAWPVVEGVISNIHDDKSVFVTAYTGQRAEWKDPHNEFRGEPYHVKSVPTLLVNGKEGRLE